MKKAVIFDVDGVILNSEKSYKERRAQFFLSKGIALSEEMNQSFIGSNPKAMMKAMFPGDEALQEDMRQSYLHFSEGFTMDTRDYLNPDILDLLEKLKEKQLVLAIASSGNYENIQKMLSVNHLSAYFDLVVSGEQFEESKPHPEIYRYTVEKLGLKKEQCLVVEDSTLGIRAAKDAGLEVLALMQTDYQVDQTQATAQIAFLEEVLEYL